MLKKILYSIIFLCSIQNVYCEENLTNEITENNIIPNEKNYLIAQDSIEKSDQKIDADIFETDFKKTFIKMMITLAVIVILIIITFWMFKRLMRHKIRSANHTQSIRILERRALSQKSVLYLVEVENEKVLLSESHLEVRNIHSLENEAELEEEE